MPPGITPAAQAKQWENDRARQALEALHILHQAEFRSATQRVAPLPELPSFEQVLAEAVRQRTRGIWPHQRAARRLAHEEARATAERWAVQLLGRARAQQAAEQRELDRQWSALMANEPDAVGAAVTAALRSAAAPVAFVRVQVDHAVVRVRAAAVDELPTHKPAATPSGAPTTHKLNKTELASLQHEVTAARVLVAAKHVLAVAPGLRGVHAVATSEELDAAAAGPVLAATVQRSDLRAGPLAASAKVALKDCADDLYVELKGRTRAMQVLDLSDDPRYAAAVSSSR